jgi:hypothetical protein
MGRDSRRRLSRVESLLPGAIEGLLKRREESKQRWTFAARVHATAVAGIVLVGGPKIDEPWTSALARAVAQYKPTDKVLESIDKMSKHLRATYEARVGRPFVDECSKPDDGDDENKIPRKLIDDTWEDLVKATEQIKPLIMKGEPEAERFTEIFKTAPIGMLKVTSTFVDAKLLGFNIPDLSSAPEGGRIGITAFRWPLLPLEGMTESSPIAAQVIDVSNEDCLFVVETANKPSWEWTRKERLLMSELCERLSGREVDPALTVKIEAQKRRDDLYSELRSSQPGQQGRLASRRHSR